MFTTPPVQEVAHIYILSPSFIDHLKHWDPTIDESKITVLSSERVTWNDGSLGCPMPGRCYTQALVPGFLIWLQIEDSIFEVHTDQFFRSFAMPGVGFF